jgi:hypothetical protein
MMLTELRARGIVLSLDAGGLIVRAPRGLLTEADRAALRANNLELEQALVQEAMEASFGLTELAEALPGDVADVRWNARRWTGR